MGCLKILFLEVDLKAAKKKNLIAICLLKILTEIINILFDW